MVTIIGFLSVYLSTFGIPLLENIIDSASLDIFETGVRYEFYHGLAILFIGLLYGSSNKELSGAGWLFFHSLVLYLIALTEIPIWGSCSSW